MSDELEDAVVFGGVGTASSRDYEVAPDVVSVRRFRKRFTTLFEQVCLEDEPDDELQADAVNLNVDHLKIDTTYEEVQKDIAKSFSTIQNLSSPPGTPSNRTTTENGTPRSQRRVSIVPTAAAANVIPCSPVTNMVSTETLGARGEHLFSIREREKKKTENTPSKGRRREVNYITGSMQVANDKVTEDARPVDSNEVLLSVAVYHPQKPVKTQEFLVLGSQLLTELRDRIYCLSDYLPDSESTPSGFFFIENVFYNDFRKEGNMDYSREPLQWINDRASRSGYGWKPAETALMESTKFEDLQVCVGSPYLYLHQGGCEHRIVVTNIRLLHDLDVKLYGAYPLQIFQSKISRRKCRICDIYSAKYVTYADKLSPDNPCFFCEQCYRPFHYTYEGNLLYSDFEVYKYYHE
eukprot:GFYU01014655.1.p1 GENE.GFYU01014655.1~~GFYU01014655.1.p1  ORF type:complete len:428 (-),score=24.28 GFYU01014655.1:16-1239(-)